MSRADGPDDVPRAVVHKRILDVAESRPDASLERIAGEVGGATPDLVERVLEEYGDPADSHPDTETQDQTMKGNGQTADETDPDPDVGSTLTDRQRETLRAVHDHPDWSQADIAETLGVSRATVSRRLNDIPGFEWEDRATFTRDVFDDDPATGGADPDRDAGDADDADGPEESAGVDASAATATPERVDERLDALETRVDTLDGDGVDLPPDLVHKVVHACMESDRVTEDEELRLLKAVL